MKEALKDWLVFWSLLEITSSGEFIWFPKTKRASSPSL